MGILVLGDLIIDEYWHGTTSRLSPEAPVPVIKDIDKEVRAGGAANVALNLHRMGSSVRLISQASITTDVSFLADVDHELLLCELTPQKTRIITDDHIVCRLDEERYQPARWAAHWFDHDPSFCVLSDYNKGFLHHSMDIIQCCNELGIKTIVDPKKAWRNYHGCWLLKANAKELAEEIGRDFDTAELRSLCSELAREYDISNLVITLGSEGLYAWDWSGGELITTEQATVLDVTGAGDVVIAALAHYLEKGFDLRESARRANALATLSVSKQGSYVVTQQDMAAVEGKTVFTNGCFDVLHAGHLHYLRQSRTLGTKLIVGLNSDRSVRALKGAGRPVNTEQDRKAMLESLEFVDEVIIFDEPTPKELIAKVKPDVITKGGDYTVDQVVGNDMVNQVVIIPTVEGYSTTDTIRRIRA